MVPTLKFENYLLPSQFENMTNSEKAPFERENKVRYIRFCFEARLPNYLQGSKTFQMKSLILEINFPPRVETCHAAECCYCH